MKEKTKEISEKLDELKKWDKDKFKIWDEIEKQDEMKLDEKKHMRDVRYT